MLMYQHMLFLLIETLSHNSKDLIQLLHFLYGSSYDLGKYLFIFDNI